MYFKGVRIYKLSEMIPGQIYLFAETDPESAPKRLTSTGLEEQIKDSDGNMLYTFILISKKDWSVSKEVEYTCDLLEAPEGQSEFKFFETLDQDSLDVGTAALYKLSEV